MKKKMFNLKFLIIFILVQKFILFIFQSQTLREERESYLKREKLFSIWQLSNDETCIFWC
jgi:hypothetical protein